MPVAHTADVKRWLQDHDTDIVNEVPPVQNQWYTVFNANDVRLLWCVILQENDEVGAKNAEIKWTIDGNVYLGTESLTNGDSFFVYRSEGPSTGGTSGLVVIDAMRNAVAYVDKKGLSFKVEVRITSALGTNQTLVCYCVRETLEQT